MGALVGIIVEYLPYLVKAAKAVPEITGFIQSVRDHSKQSKEWTAEERATFDRRLEELTGQEHWKTDEERGKK